MLRFVSRLLEIDFLDLGLEMPDGPIHFGIPLQLGQERTEFPVGNGNAYIRYKTCILVDMGETYPHAHDYLAWCYRIRTESMDLSKLLMFRLMG